MPLRVVTLLKSDKTNDVSKFAYLLDYKIEIRKQSQHYAYTQVDIFRLWLAQ